MAFDNLQIRDEERVLQRHRKQFDIVTLISVLTESEFQPPEH